MMIIPEFFDSLIRPVLNSITKEYDCEWVVTPDLNDDPFTLRVRFTDINAVGSKYKDAHLIHLFDLLAIKNAYDPPLYFVSEVRRVLDEWKSGDRNKKYRDILVELIKSAGQQLIDRAEEMVSEKLAFVTGFTINVDIPQPADRPVSISWTTETIDTNQLK